MPFDGLIFDLDGTLWDSSLAVTAAWNTAIAGERNELTQDDIAGVMGLPMGKIFEKFFPDSDDKTRETMAEKCFSEELSMIRRNGAALYAGVQEGLETLAKRFPLFVVSNCQTDYMQLFLETSGLGPLFKDTECHGNTRKAKGDNIRLVMERNGLARAAYVGDTAGDQQAARKAGAVYFHVDYGFGAPIDACPRFASFSALVAHFVESQAIKG